ncbi:MAG: hypothetical protein RL404_658 [Pseudomonadota bacterium]|jgi:hypothetical protein
MSIFKLKSGYVSDFTRFIDDLKQKQPQIEADQQQGRARLWDKDKLNLDEMRRAKESRVQQQAYVYQSH